MHVVTFHLHFYKTFLFIILLRLNIDEILVANIFFFPKGELEFCLSFFPSKKSHPPVYSTMPVSLQARGRRPRNWNKG